MTYYDFRQAATMTFQPTDLWLAVTRDAATWRETRLAGNFDLLDAPNAGGLFVGDYNGLVGTGSTFVALYARTNTGDTANRTDVFADRVNGDVIIGNAKESPVAGQKTKLPPWTEAASERVAEHLSSIKSRRSARWRSWRNAEPEPD